MRILHTSDWHLGRIFHGVYLTEDQAHVLQQFIQLVAEARPDVILITGDIYDRSVPPAEAIKLLDETLSRILMDYRAPIILIAGNHDSPDRLGFGARLLARQGLHLVGQLTDRLAPVVINDAHGPVYFCPAPYAEPPLVRERLLAPEAVNHEQAMLSLIRHLSASIPAGARRVLLAHAFAAGGEESESERPLSVGGSGTVSAALFAPFNYAALGHLHQPQKVGGEHVRYAGSLLKYSFSETSHQKSVTLVEMDGAGHTALETVSLTPRRDVRRLEGYFTDILSGPASGESRDDYIMVTLRDTGPIMDAIGKLRQVYPNVLHLERPDLTAGGQLRGPGGDHRRLNETELFSSFFAQVTGTPLSVAQNKAFAETLEKFYRQEREVRS
ncbi:MAG: exonuclease SbcCD subunit D [Desulfotomaculaceae bacterium]|nr:exonuclease SbcCD subunit D [Desulfotomaculaceae bacterium]